ncbi:MAG: tRNA threonylcarbamoyladenosine dehydratase, partial [Clostridia bacterium]|nr:tRNA threonylcarbamoyladenosine dehydratase [Clostridia bacterium]
IRPLEDMSISCLQHCICPPGTARKFTKLRDIPGSTAFVTSVVGLIIAGEVVNDLAGKKAERGI